MISMARLTGVNVWIMVLGIFAAVLVNYTYWNYVEPSFEHVRLVEQAQAVAASDLRMEADLQANIATLNARLATVPQPKRISQVVEEVRQAAARSRVAISSIQANATPSITVRGNLGELLGFMDSMGHFAVPLDVKGVTLTGVGDKLEAVISASI